MWGLAKATLFWVCCLFNNSFLFDQTLSLTEKQTEFKALVLLSAKVPEFLDDFRWVSVWYSQVMMSGHIL